MLALPKEVEHWSLTTLREQLVRIGAKVVSHGRYVTFQLAFQWRTCLQNLAIGNLTAKQISTGRVT